VNIDHAMKAADWVAWMQTSSFLSRHGLRRPPLNDNKELARTFLMDLGLTAASS
jgi:hypothetical protein